MTDLGAKQLVVEKILNFEIKMDDSAEPIYQFEENQVLWAKIRGYPWWPAYVNEVHTADAPENFQFTVVFFGDNTNSRLGPSKLRKFLQSYGAFYQKAKTNRKLKLSIEKAEERLKENSQDVAIYERLRTDMKIKKKKGGTRSQSKISSEDKSELIDAPQLIKHRTHPVGRPKKKKQVKVQMEEEEEEQQIQSVKEPISEKEQQNDEEVHSPSKNLRRKTRSMPARITRQSIPHARPLPFLETPVVEEQQMSDEEDQPPSNKSHENSLSEKSAKGKREGVKKRGRPPIKKPKKGRPRKVDIAKQKKQKQKPRQKQKYEEKDDELSPPSHHNKSKRNHLHETNEHLVVKNTAQINKIKQVLENRKELIKLLSSMQINTNNVQEILELKVTDIILDGPITKGIHTLLHSLKATLLHKYFPEDSKHRKKHERLSKEKRKYRYSSQDEQQKREQSEEEEPEPEPEPQPKVEDSIRTKTIVKLEKIIKKSGLEEGAKNIAVKFEKSFQDTSDKTGQKYAAIAYSRMRKLKDNLNSLAETQKSATKVKEYLDKQLKELLTSSDSHS